MDSLLDTDVLSQSTKPTPDAKIMAWLAQVNSSELYISAVSIAEIRIGIDTMPQGHKRQLLEHWISHNLRPRFSGRILPVDDQIAEKAGKLVALGIRAGRAPGIADAMIAATALIRGMRVATRNRKHFEHFDLELVQF